MRCSCAVVRRLSSTAAASSASASASSSSASARLLRSREWFGRRDKNGFIYRSWMKNQGFPADLFDERPVIGICNTWSELAPCNAHLRKLAEHVKRGVWEAGGFPLEFPAMGLGETMMRPTTMLYRNLLSMEVEETLRANPVDGVVLLAGCDKTTPGTLMGAASVDLPTLLVSGGPMLNGKFCGCDLGSGTSLWKMSEDVRAGRMSMESFLEAEAAMSRSQGHCNTMGTASSMACMAESLGIALPTNGAIPVLAHKAGRRIVEMTLADVRMSQIITRASLENAVRTNAAIGGSSNFVVHMLALAGRLGLPLELEDFDRLGSAVPLLVNLLPSGKHLMEDFYYAGGLPVVHRRLLEAGLLHGDAATVSGAVIADNVRGAKCWNDEVIRPMETPLVERAGLVVLRGSLAPQGAILKPSAATPALMQHRGRAFVFESREHMYSVLDRDDLPVDETTVLVLKGQGPRGYPGMPETGNMPIPAKLLRRGVSDMVRISDARMSGTAFGTVALHVAPESAVGGPLAAVRTGDVIELDVAQRRLELVSVSADELTARLRVQPPVEVPVAEQRGYTRLYRDHVLQADRGCDFDFLVGKSGRYVPRDNH